VSAKSPGPAPTKVKSTPAEAKEKRVASKQTFFIGLGISTDVPQVLRYIGKIRNRRISRSDCYSLIREIWQAKIISSNTSTSIASLSEFMYTFLKKRFGYQDSVMEWAYNIYESSRKHSELSATCKIFFNILTDKSVEGLYFHAARKVEAVRLKFQDQDIHLHEGKGIGLIPRAAAVKIMDSLAPDKSQRQIDGLKNAIDADQSSSQCSYRWLFESSNDSAFTNLLAMHEFEAQERYISDLRVYFNRC
jgi:hypothetical protein